MNVPIPFGGTEDEAMANFHTHLWCADGDEVPVCGNCDAKLWHVAARYPCGEEPPRGVEIVTPPCPHCTHRGTLILTEPEYEMLIAADSPNLQQWMERPAEFREQIITGTHPACWDAMWADVDDEGRERGENR